MGRQLTVDGAAVDARVAAVLDDSPVEDDDETMAAARAAVASRDDRWFGRLVAAACDSTADSTNSGLDPDPDRLDPDPARDAVAAAATAVELVCGYCRLRADLLSALDGGRDAALASDHSAALLAGDYLHAAAFESLQSVPDATTGACVETLTGALGSVRTTLAGARSGSTSAAPREQTAVDGTAGCVGAAAAGLGATLAGAGDRRADALARAGRALATVHATDRLLDSGPEVSLVPSHAVDESRLREQATRRRENAAAALRELPEAVDASALQSLASQNALLQRERS